MHHKGTHYSPSMGLREQAALGDYLCKQIDVWREKQGLPAFTNAHLKTNSSRDAVRQVNALSATLKAGARGDDDDSRQIIADLISDDRSPFTPDDEEALRRMSSASLRQMRSDFLKANHTPPVANLAGRDFSFGAGIAGADFARRQAQIRANSDAYIASNPVQRAVTNSNDEAAQAMSANIGAVEYLRQKGGK